MKYRSQYGCRKGREGTVLFLVVMMILSLSTVSLISYGLLVTDVSINRNQVNTSRALYHADAGIKYVKRVVESELEQGHTLSDILSNLQVHAPDGLAFDSVNEFKTVIPERLFEVQVVGRSEKANTMVEASLRRRNAFQAGIFGHHLTDVYPHAGVRAYDTRVHPEPWRSQVPGGASIGSNVMIDMHTSALVDGSFMLGADSSGNVATCDDCGNGEIMLIGNIDPDPLGLNGGELDAEMQAASLVNDNHSVGHIHHHRLQLKPQQEETLTSGNYYLDNLELKSGSTLNIDSSEGPVRIFVKNSMKVWPNSTVNHGGLPGDFQIISPVQSEIKILPNSNYNGMIYAPNADVRVMPNGDYFGLIWAYEAEVKPSGAAYIDIALLEQFLLNELVLQHWREFRAN